MHLLQATAQATPHTEAHHSNFVMPPPHTQSLRLHSTRANRNRSMGDLPRHAHVWSAMTRGVGVERGGGGIDWSRSSQPAFFFESTLYGAAPRE